jgi:hypothetical protein
MGDRLDEIEAKLSTMNEYMNDKIKWHGCDMRLAISEVKCLRAENERLKEGYAQLEGQWNGLQDALSAYMSENERLRDLICRAAPLAWVHNHADPEAIEYAHRWEIEAGKLIGINNPDQER